VADGEEEEEEGVEQGVVEGVVGEVDLDALDGLILVARRLEVVQVQELVQTARRTRGDTEVSRLVAPWSGWAGAIWTV